MLAESLIEGLDIPIFVVDPEDVNEIQEVAKITGHPDFPRGRMETGYHVLNHKAVARQAAKDMGKTYQDVNFVVAHLGGGVSIAAHMKGRVIDTTSGGPGGEGPFAINRSGPLPCIHSLRLALAESIKKGSPEDCNGNRWFFCTHRLDRFPLN